ncbi:MAG: hypothetical protein QOG89_2288 [Thermomicrobiales bacterium]|nr:hypothetical protein [Thermomicrobiales bacterium]MEA2523622.1 hypothetical protein [Thermomicrobiales bacterium]MEA2530644.1 hypothetical protein [Thermomicrobiales bacterium]
MTGWRQFLAQHLRAPRGVRASASPAATPQTVTAHVRAEGWSGIRSIRIRDFQLLSDSGPECAGFHVGPTSPELQLGALGSCLTDTFLSQAAERGVVLESVEVEIIGALDPCTDTLDNGYLSLCPRDISYTAHLCSPASADEIEALHAAVERVCPVLNLLVQPQSVRGSIVLEVGSPSDPAASRN